MAESANPADRRVEERSDCDLDARIELTGRESIPCLVKDLSEAGIRIQIERSIELPEQFAILVPAVPDADQRFEVRVVWRRGDEIGGTFVRPPE